MRINPLLWIDNPQHPDAPKALRALIEGKISGDMLERMTETDLNSERGQYEMQSALLGVVDELPRMADHVLTSVAIDSAAKHTFRAGEHETVEEWIASYTDPEFSKSIRSDAAFIAEKVVPFMNDNGLDTKGWVGKNNALSTKIRAAVPTLRDSLNDPDMAPEQLEPFWRRILSWVGDDKVTAEEIRERHNNGGKKIPAIQGVEFIQPSGSIIILKLNAKQDALLKNRLGGQIKLVLGDKWPKKASEL